AGPAGASGPFARLGDHLRASVEGMTVRRFSGETSRDVLSGLSIELRREGEAAFRTRGEGQPDHGGRLGWDLLVEPLDLRAVGSVDLADVALAVFEPF